MKIPSKVKNFMKIIYTFRQTNCKENVCLILFLKFVRKKNKRNRLVCALIDQLKKQNLREKFEKKSEILHSNLCQVNTKKLPRLFEQKYIMVT